MLPVTALAASNTITSGTYTGIYGNNGAATVPTDDTNASGNTLTIGDGTHGPTLLLFLIMAFSAVALPPVPLGAPMAITPYCRYALKIWRSYYAIRTLEIGGFDFSYQNRRSATILLCLFSRRNNGFFIMPLCQQTSQIYIVYLVKNNSLRFSLK